MREEGWKRGRKKDESTNERGEELPEGKKERKTEGRNEGVPNFAFDSQNLRLIPRICFV